MKTFIPIICFLTLILMLGCDQARSFLPTQALPDCNDLQVDIFQGTMNGISPTNDQDTLKSIFPCYTGSTGEDSKSNYGGGVFFLNHQFFFYTKMDFLEIRTGFPGEVTDDFMKSNRKRVISILGEPLGEATETWTESIGIGQEEKINLTVLTYKMPYGWLRAAVHKDQIYYLQMKHGDE